MLSVTGVALVAGLIGALSGLVEGRGLLVVLIGATGVLALVAARVVLAPAEGAERAEDTGTASNDGYSAARIFFYLGAAAIGLLTVRPALTLTASDGFFFASLGFAGLVLFATRFRHDYLVPKAVTIGILLFAIGGLVSSIGAVAPGESVAVVIRLLYLTLIWFWLATAVLRTRAHIETAVLAWACSAALSSAGAVAQFFLGDVIPGGTISYGRMTGFTTHFNSLGGLAATAFVPALWLAVDSRRTTTKLLGVVCVGFIVSGLLLSGSVGGLIALTAGTVFWLAVRGVTLRTALALGGVAMTGVVLFSAVGWTDVQSPLERVQRVTAPELAASGLGGTVYTRIDGYRAAWEQIKVNPLVGVGLDEPSSVEVLGPSAVHSVLINPWFSAGVLGLVGMLLIVIGALVAGYKAVRFSPLAARPLAAALLASLIAFVVSALSEPILFVRYGWFAAALLIALRAHQRRAASAVVPTESPLAADARARRPWSGLGPVPG